MLAKGVDTIACTAVNDVFVMHAWGKDIGVGDKITMLADGNGDYVKLLGLEFDGSGFGMGSRGQRFAIVAIGELSSDELFAGKKVVLVSVPGACRARSVHCPGS